MGLEIKLAPDILFHIGSFPVTNTFFWTVILSLFLMGFSIFISSRLKTVPGKIQNVVEMLIEGAYSFIKSIMGSDKKTRRIFPLVLTMFIFIAVANLATYIPGQAAISIHKQEGTVALFRAIISDYSLVLMMTLITFFITQIGAIVVLGPFGYLGKFINLKGPMAFFLGIMDLVGELAKIVSLSFRLFGNMFAGEVLGTVMLFLAPFFMPLPFMFLGLLTAVVQAFVFSVLTVVFVNMATETEAEKVNEEN